MVREGSVNKVNKEEGWKKGDTFIFWSSRGEQVRATREDVRSCELGSRDMDHCKVKIC